MIASAESFIQRWRGITTEKGLFDLYDTYTSGMFPADKKGKKRYKKIV